MDHYNISHKNLVGRCMKCMYKTYSGYHFFDNCKVNRTGLISSVHSNIDYTDIIDNDSDSDDNIDNNIDKDKDKDYYNEILIKLKANIIENLKDYIKKELKTEILNDLKTETNIKKKSNETDNKTTRVCCLCKIEKNTDCFYKTGGLCKDCCCQNVSCPTCNIVINRSSLNKHKKGHIINQFQIYNNIFKMITNYKDYFRLYSLIILYNLK